MNLEDGGFYRQRDDADVESAVFDAFEDLTAKIAVNADLHGRVQSAVLGEDVGQHVDAGGFIGAESEDATRSMSVIGNGASRFFAKRDEVAGVFEQNFSGGSEADRFADAIEKFLAVLLLKLADLSTDRRL